MVEQLKKAPANVSLWDVISIPEQKTLLHETLKMEEKSMQASATQLDNHSVNEKFVSPP